MRRVLILAHDATAADGLRRQLHHAPAFDVVACVGGRADCRKAVVRTAPDAVVIDEMGADAVTLSRIREARSAVPAAQLVLLTRSTDPDWLGNARRAGIDSAVSKTMHGATLAALVRHVVAGSVFNAFDTAPAPLPGDAGAAGLTDRELEVLRLVAVGLSNARIAAQLWVTEQTVKFHLSNTYRKLGVTSRTQASHCAYALRLVEIEPAPAIAAEDAA